MLEVRPPPIQSKSQAEARDRPVSSQVPQHKRNHGDQTDKSEDEQARRVRTRQHHCNRHHKNHSSTSDSDMSPDRGSSALLSHTSSQRFQETPLRHSNTRLPPFKGQEPWKVYYNRFQDVAWGEG